MKLERSRVEFPLWRKKVDKSLFEHNGTTIPAWACEMWGLPELFADVTSKRDPDSKVTVNHQDNSYDGWVTVARHKRKSPAYRLWFEDTLSLELKRCFLMSYMRALEAGLSASESDVEDTIPFWEFLDIEFDKKHREFRFLPYYHQKPSFPNLFARLIGSPAMETIGDEVLGKTGTRIHKQDWKPRSQLEYEIGATNVIYMLIDTKNRLLYIGEAIDLVKRLLQRYPSIPHWDHFRYDVLPDSLAQFRVALERMLIRGFATLLDNKKGISNIQISDYRLANDRIDK